MTAPIPFLRFFGSAELAHGAPSCRQWASVGCLSIAIAFGILPGAAAKTADIAFSTGGHTVYHLKPATVSKDGGRVVIAAAYDGYVTCHGDEGRLLWKIQPGTGFPFDLKVGDIDGDGLDEALVASSDGKLYAIDHDGRLLWTFSAAPPLYQAGIAKIASGSVVVLTGGVDKTLYALSQSGEIVAKFAADGVIRLIQTGPILGDGVNYAAVTTATSWRASKLRIHRLPTLEPLWKRQMSYDGGTNRYYSMELCDLDDDGRLEMVFGLGSADSDRIAIYDYQGNGRTIKTCGKLRQRPYKMNFATLIKSPTLKDEYFVNLSGNMLLVFDRNGHCRNLLKGPYAFAGTAFDSQTNTYWLGSGISGGDGVYGIRVDQPGWEKRFEAIKPVGRMAQLEKNMALLLKQTERFSPPPYQRPAGQTLVTVGDSPEQIRDWYVKSYGMRNVTFAAYRGFVEHYDPGITNPKLRQEWERYHKHNVMSHDSIIRYVEERERNGEPFFVFAGHGRGFGIDFYSAPSTYVEMLKKAPKTLMGFVFAELEGTDSVLAAAVRDQLIPLADACYEHGRKKILLRNKNIFWNANVYLDLFAPIMSQEKYREIFVPAMEETNSRSQSLSLAGRTGLWLSGRFNHIAGRAVTDNANYDRLWEWGQTQHLSHFIRHMSLNRIQGANIFQINVYTDNEREMLPFYLMLEKGILPMPGKEDILSLSDLTIGIRSPDQDFLRHGGNGHWEATYAPSNDTFVFDRLDCYWGGAPLQEHDFERYAFHAARRMTNFLAQSPYGNLTTISADTKLGGLPYFRRMLVTDGRYWYDETGARHSAEAYKPVVLEALQDAATRLPIRVHGEAAWAALRVDASHARIVLIDPGYLDPADRTVDIVFQRMNAIEAVDILSGEKLPITNGRITGVRIPLGILRVIDVVHR